ncbi:related to USO1-intracellular protein transport protein [Phialocephala subalpina]|uniref:Related to USO1-intracellular protein transport protein n=1 Tax=Phialocephala subalpina TaxID=576137 RepID=A0A1L7X443_9HELO|nr:related to USO1-intracellular protein transport protein [Phialocephala subalpina]
MGSPLSEAGPATLNSVTPTKGNIFNEYEVTMHSSANSDSDGPPSSPFVANVSDSIEDCENISPSKISRLASKSPIDREPNSPLKMLKSRASPTSKSQSPSPRTDPNTLRSPRKMSSPEKRFPVKPSSPAKQPSSPQKSPTIERTMTIEDVLRDNAGLTKAIEILEDEDSEMDHTSDDTLTSLNGIPTGNIEESNMDDTMVSTFSNFSAVPDMTMFAKIGHSPTKYAGMGPTPRRTQMNTPATLRRPPQDRSPSPTPRGHRYGKSKDEGNTTNLILDFTDQFNGFSGRPQYSPRKQSPLKSTTMPDMSYASTPTVNRHNISNLLDFDIPPAPTPRSMPSITPRELESLKSNFLSEISSLKASLSGKEAEVQSLKTAVGDAEKRVGESLEQVREERNSKEQLAAEMEEWEKRSREMEAVLRNVKEEIVHGERERDQLEGRLEESERRRDAAEMMAQEAESKMAAMRAGKLSPTSPTSDTSEKKAGECECGGRAVELAVEKVSRELHTLYKDKHETKVSALKKSYEKRWEKKVRELENKIEDLSKENEEIRLGRDTTITNLGHEREEGWGVSRELHTLYKDKHETKVSALKKSYEKRWEKKAWKGHDNQMENSTPSQPSQSVPQGPSHSNVENLRGSISRASGLRAPGSMAQGESRIGRGGFGVPAGNGHERTRSGSAQGMRPGSGMGYRSGIMSSIEKMGNHKGRGGE